MSALASDIIRYARGAKIQRFRYCRRPANPNSPHAALSAAIAALKAELRLANSRPICQTSAAELLKELAALGHQPPCQGHTEQKLAAQIVNRALLEIR
ncbi:hypothetical protein VDG1235_4149 [Verrucomicrobiia bacterium DG1235]|nr:hypothetical protein VDG1235_4149 [Verrucomicrobiae bacterium DG1235]